MVQGISPKDPIFAQKALSHSPYLTVLLFDISQDADDRSCCAVALFRQQNIQDRLSNLLVLAFNEWVGGYQDWVFFNEGREISRRCSEFSFRGNNILYDADNIPTEFILATRHGCLVEWRSEPQEVERKQVPRQELQVDITMSGGTLHTSRYSDEDKRAIQDRMSLIKGRSVRRGGGSEYGSKDAANRASTPSFD